MNTLKDAIQAIKSGDKATGRALLLQIVKTNPKQENAWLWLAAAVETPAQKRDCLRKVLAINPHNQTAQAGLKQLEQQAPAEAEEEPQLQDILPAVSNPKNKPQPRQAPPQPLTEEPLRDDPGQAGEIAMVYLKLIGYLVLPATIIGTLLFLIFASWAISFVSDTSIGDIDLSVSFGEMFVTMFSIEGLRLLHLFGGHYVPIFLLLMSFVMGTWHILAVRRLPGGKKAGALQLRQVRTIKLKLPFERTVRACQEAALMRGGQIISVGKSSGKIQAKTSMSMKGWGETLLFQVTALEDNLTEVVFMSKPVLRTLLVDLGQNLENVEAIRRYLKLQERQAES